jgi:hypothetical protein
MNNNALVDSPGGFGPWFCAFMVNTGEKPKKFTHVAAHTMPHLLVDALNRTGETTNGAKSRKRTREQDCWIMVFKIGPFNYWQDSVDFLNQWLCKTRGKIHRMERGLELFSMYRQRFHLCLWTQPRKRDDALHYFWNNQLVVTVPFPSVAAAAATATTESKENDKRESFKAWLEESCALFTQSEQPTLGNIRARIY